jgi:hypothetical protein
VVDSDRPQTLLTQTFSLYGLRSCTECVYRSLKSDGWQWHNTRLLDPQRAERMWLVLAVATQVDGDTQVALTKINHLPPILNNEPLDTWR